MPGGIAISAGDGQSAVVGTGLSTAFIVTVTDGSGGAISDVNVDFRATGGAVLSDTVAATDASGMAETTVVVGNSVGVDTITATVAGVNSTATITANATAGAASYLTLVSGNNQTGTHGTALGAPFVVLVHDQFGNKVAGATVTWLGSFGGVTSTADTTGQALLHYTLPATIGTDTVTAAVASTGSAVIFSATGS